MDNFYKYLYGGITFASIFIAAQIAGYYLFSKYRQRIIDRPARLRNKEGDLARKL